VPSHKHNSSGPFGLNSHPLSENWEGGNNVLSLLFSRRGGFRLYFHCSPDSGVRSSPGRKIGGGTQAPFLNSDW